MRKYVDGFVIPVALDKLDAYRAMAEAANKIWMEYGALATMECVGEDLNIPDTLGFPAMVKLQPGETVIFAWIVFASREHRDEVNAKVLADPRIKEKCIPENMPFDCQRMAYGGFRSIVEN